MKKKIFSMVGVAAFAVAVAFNINASINNDASSNFDVTLANVEALVMGETSDEFTKATDCVACTRNHTCSGKDGKTHTWAHHKDASSHD